MSINKTIRDVAEVAAKIMSEKLHPNQQVLDVHEPEKDKLTAQDFKKLRAMKKEEAEVQQEGWDDMMKAVKDRSGPQPSGGAGVKKGRAYGGSAQKDKPEQDADKPKKKKLSEMVAMYKESGLKSLAEMTKVEQINEEPDNEQFTKEVEDQKASMAGKKKQPSVAAPSTQGVKTMPEEVEIDGDEFTAEEISEFMQTEEYQQLDELSKEKLGWYLKKASKHMDKKGENMIKRDKKFKTGMNPLTRAFGGTSQRMQSIAKASNKYLAKEETEQIDERTLTEPEMKKKEEVVKSMKKGMAGFKQRYGERAKSV